VCLIIELLILSYPGVFPLKLFKAAENSMKFLFCSMNSAFLCISFLACRKRVEKLLLFERRDKCLEMRWLYPPDL